jgi:peroxiredoxin Q/BCP
MFRHDGDGWGRPVQGAISALAGRRTGAKVPVMISLGRILGKIQGDSLSLGSRMPEVSQINQDGARVDLSDLAAQGWLLVYFYPKAGTPLCTRQACGLRDAFETLAESGIKVLGVSADTHESQRAFRERFKLPFDLLADVDGSVRKAFGVPGLLGIPMRRSFLFKDGMLVWKDASPSPDTQAADVLHAIRGG